MALNYYAVDKGINIINENSSVETQVLNGSFDPSSAGQVADIGSLFLRSNGSAYLKTGAGATDWTVIGGDVASAIIALSAAIDVNSSDITFLSGEIDDNTADILTISGDLLALSGDFENHTHVKADITDFVESDYVHTTGAETIAGIKTFTNDVVVNGDFTVNGTTTTVSSTDLVITDNTITLNYGETGAGVSLGTAGFEIDRGSLSGVSLRWNEGSDTWQVTENGADFYDIIHDGNLSSNTDITALSAAIDLNASDITDLETLVGTLNSGNYIAGTEVAADLTALDNAIFTVSGDLDTIQSDITDIETTIGTLSAGNYISGVEIAADLVALDDNLLAVSGDLDTAEINIANNTADILTVSGDLDTLEDTVANLEPEGSAAAVTSPTVLDSVPLVDGNVVKWHVYAKEDAAANHRALEIHAMHDGISTVDFNAASVLRIGSNIAGSDVDVIVNGANLELVVDASNATTFRYKRIVEF